MSWVLMAVKNVRRNRRRSLLTILVAAVGAAALLLGGGFARYTYAGLEQAAARDTGHVVVAHRAYFGGDEDVPMQHGLDDAPALRAELAADPRVREVLPRVQFMGLVSNGEKSSVFVGAGVDPGAELRVRGPFLTVTAGEELSEAPAAGALPEVMLGSELSRSLRAPPGAVLTLLSTTTQGSLNAQDVRVRGVYTVGVPDVDRRAVLVHLATAQRLLLTDRVSTLAAYLRDGAATDAVAAAVARRHPERAVQTWRDQAFYFKAVQALYDRLFGVLGIILVGLVLFSVSNTLGMAVVERTREIGTLRALGAVPGQVTRGFVLEGAVVGAAGAAAGALAAAALSLVLDLADLQMPPPPGRSVGYPLRIARPLALYGWTALAIVATSMLAAWLVSRRAAARPITEALTHV